MMDDIEVGEYVRTKDGVIDIVDALYGMIENTVHLEKQKWFDTRNIVKHSKNLIDLIEVGELIETDYGMGWFHHKIDEEKFLFDDGKELIEVQSNEIKSILTKEQYTANCYKVGGEDE